MKNKSEGTIERSIIGCIDQPIVDYFSKGKKFNNGGKTTYTTT